MTGSRTTSYTDPVAELYHYRDSISYDDKIANIMNTSGATLSPSGTFTICQNGTDIAFGGANWTVGDFINKASEYGISVTINGNKLQAVSANNNYVKASFLNDSTHTTIYSYGTTASNADARKGADNSTVIGSAGELQKTVTYAVNDNTNVSYLGVSAGDIKAFVNGVQYNIGIGSATTIGELKSALAGYGFTLTETTTNGKTVYGIDASGDRYLEQGTSNLYSVLFNDQRHVWTYKSTENGDADLTHVDNTRGITAEMVNGTTGRNNGSNSSIDTKGELQKTVTYASNDNANMEYLNISEGNLFIYENGNKYTLNITKTTTMAEIKSALAAHGLTVNESATNGMTTYSINATGNRYLEAGTSDIWTKLFTNERQTYTHNTTRNGDANLNSVNGTTGRNDSNLVTCDTMGELQKTVTYNVDDNTNMQYFTNMVGTFYAVQDGVEHMVTLNATTTVGDLKNILNGYGITLQTESTSSGTKFTIDTYTNSYITTNSSTTSHIMDYITTNNEIYRYNSTQNGDTDLNSVNGTTGRVDKNLQSIDTMGELQKTVTYATDRYSSTDNEADNTNMKYLNVTAGKFLIHDGNSTYTATITETTTIGDLRALLASHGMTLQQTTDTNTNTTKYYIDTINHSNNVNANYIEAYNGDNASNIMTQIFDGTTFTYKYRSTENDASERVNATNGSIGTTGELQVERRYNSNDNTMLKYVGVTQSGTYIIRKDGVNHTMTINNTSTTIGDLKNQLAQYGITLTQSNNSNGVQYTLSTDNDTQIFDGTSDLIKGMFDQNTTFYNVDRNTQLSAMGVTKNGEFEVLKNGTRYTVSVNTTTTLGQLADSLSTYGINFDFTSTTGGNKLIISTPDNVDLWDRTTDAVEKIFGGHTTIYDYGTRELLKPITVTVRYNATEDTVLGRSGASTVGNGSYGIYDFEYGGDGATTVNPTSTVTVQNGRTLRLDTLENNEITPGTYAIIDNGKQIIMTVTQNMTLGQLADELISKGFQAGYDTTTSSFWVKGSGNLYITALSGGTSDLVSTLFEGKQVSTYNYSKHLDMTTTHTENKDVSMNTQLWELGVTSGDYIIHSGGHDNTVNISDTSTIGDLKEYLSDYGINLSIVGTEGNSRITLRSSEDAYIKSATGANASNIITKLGISESDKTYNYGTELSQEKSYTNTIDATSSSLLRDFGITSGEFCIVSDGVSHNVNISTDDTFANLQKLLNTYNINSRFEDTSSGSKFIIYSDDNSYITASANENSSNIADILAANNNMNHKGTAGITLSESSTQSVSADMTSKLSNFGITSGQYYAYDSDGIRHVVNISQDDTFATFIDALTDYGIQAALVDFDDGVHLVVSGIGKAHLEESTSEYASNIMDHIFVDDRRITYDYQNNLKKEYYVTTNIIATLDTKLSDFDTEEYKSAGNLSVKVNGLNYNIQITEDETFGSLIEKLGRVGIEAKLTDDGQFIIASGMNNFSINYSEPSASPRRLMRAAPQQSAPSTTTSGIMNIFGLTYNDDLGGYAQSSAAIEETVTAVEEQTSSAVNYVDGGTKLGLLNVTSGNLSLFRNGVKANIHVDENETVDQLKARIKSAFSDVDLTIDNGRLKIYSSTEGVKIEAGTTTDSSNMYAIAGFHTEENAVYSSREMYKVNGSSKITTEGLFKLGNVTEGTFTIGNATFTITNETTLNNLISQINSSDEANATAYWDSVDGKLSIKSRVTGYSLINIEAGTSNFTDIMGYTITETDTNNVTVNRLNSPSQILGQNAQFSINGTNYTSSSNTVGSDISRIQGVVIDLKGVSSGEEVTLTIGSDEETVANAMSDIVDSYNVLLENVDTELARDGNLNDQFALKLIRNQLRSLMTGSMFGNAVFKNFDAIGVSMQAATTGNIATKGIDVLHFDRDKFIDAFRTDKDALKTLLIGTESADGILTSIDKILEQSLASTTGYFDSTANSLNSQIQTLNKKISSANAAVERYRSRLETKFQSMDLLIGKMQNQYSSFLNNSTQNTTQNTNSLI